MMQAPVALILSVFVSSMNSAPEVSEPRRNTGTWMRRRDDRRDSEESTSGPPLRLIEAEIHSDSTRELVQREQFECQFHG